MLARNPGCYLGRMKNIPASQVMTRPLVTVTPDDPLSTAMKLMDERRVHHLLVVEGRRMAGILSSADLLKLALLLRPEAGQAASSGESLGLKVRDLMQTRVAVVRENTSLKETAQVLSLGGFHAVPVLAIDDTPVGIVTSSDLVGLLIDRIDRDETAPPATGSLPADHAETLPGLLEVLRAAEVYLHSGHSEQQHARLIRAVERVRESAGRRSGLN